MIKQVKVNSFRCDVIDKFGLDIGIKFMDELQKWDQTVPRVKLFDMYYDIDVLETMLEYALKS